MIVFDIPVQVRQRPTRNLAAMFRVVQFTNRRLTGFDDVIPLPLMPVTPWTEHVQSDSSGVVVAGSDATLPIADDPAVGDTVYAPRSPAPLPVPELMAADTKRMQRR